MKSILPFFKTTIAGGMLILLPLVLIIILLKEALIYLSVISDPISIYLPEILFGLDGSNIVALILLILLSFLAGLLIRSDRSKKLTKKIEDNILNLIPGYVLVKSILADTLKEKIEDKMSPILIKDDSSYNLAFLVEEGPNLSTVFIPDAPRHDAGEVRIIETHLIKRVNVGTNVFVRSIKNYGKGAVGWLN